MRRPALAALCQEARVRTAARGTALYRQGDPARYLFVLLRGRVKVTRQSCAGRELIVSLHAAPAALGEFAAYTARPHVMSAVALERCTVALLAARELRRGADANPHLAASLLAMFQERFEALSARIDDIAGGPVEQRLASLLVRLRPSERSGTDGEAVIPLALTRRDLGALVATTTETVVRVLTRWKEIGAIATRREGIAVRAWPPVERLALGEAQALCELWPGPGRRSSRRARALAG